MRALDLNRLEFVGIKTKKLQNGRRDLRCLYRSSNGGATWRSTPCHQNRDIPILQVISTVGFEHPENQRVRRVTPDILDEHYYKPVDAFLKAARGQYETYDRKYFEATLNDWGWHGTGDPPPWYTGEPWS